MISLNTLLQVCRKFQVFQVEYLTNLRLLRG
jgi:hypothetical protein